MIIVVPKPGSTQRRNVAAHDPNSGRSWKTSVIFQPDEAQKLLTALEHCPKVSVSGFLNELVRQMPVDQDGRPAWTGPDSEGALFDSNSAA